MILREKLSETMQVFLYGMLDYTKLTEEALVELSQDTFVVKHYADRVVQALVKVLKSQRSELSKDPVIPEVQPPGAPCHVDYLY